MLIVLEQPHAWRYTGESKGDDGFILLSYFCVPIKLLLQQVCYTCVFFDGHHPLQAGIFLSIFGVISISMSINISVHGTRHTKSDDPKNGMRQSEHIWNDWNIFCCFRLICLEKSLNRVYFKSLCGAYKLMHKCIQIQQSSLVRRVCIMEIGLHCFRQLLVAWSVPIYL